MKNIIILVLVLVIGYFVYTQFLKPKNVDTSNVQTVTTASDQDATATLQDKNTTTDKPAVAAEVTVAGMQKYVDSEFGFSFWYPADLKVTKTTAAKWDDAYIKDATVLANISVGDSNIKYVRSTKRTITQDITNFSKVSYYFDVNAHLWMKSSQGGAYMPANITDNSMGGLHLFPGVSPYSTIIIPLSANNFLVVGNVEQGNRITYLARTVVAADPAVGVVESADVQTRTIQSLKNVYETAAVKNGSTGIRAYNDSLIGFNFQYDMSLHPQVFVTKGKANINAQGCYIVSEAEGNGTNNKESITLHGVNYCVSEFSDCGMGTCGNQKYYTTYGNGAYVTIEYTTFTHNCSVGDDVATCEQEQSIRLAKELKQIEDSLGTLTFSKQ